MPGSADLSAVLPMRYTRESRDLAAQFVLDVVADDVLEAGVGLEAECQCALRSEVARPACDDLLDEGVGPTADAGHHLVAGDLREGGDLLADGDGETRHGQGAARADLGEVEAGGM